MPRTDLLQIYFVESLKDFAWADNSSHKMGSNTSGGDDIDWNSDDDREIESFILSRSGVAHPRGQAIAGPSEASSSAGPCAKTVGQFIGMGFSEEMILKAIKENGDGDVNAIVETLLTYSALENSPAAQQDVDSEHNLSDFADCEGDLLEGSSDIDDISESENILDPESDSKSKLLALRKMGYTEEEASIAIERCGPDCTILDLTDYIFAAHMAKEADSLFPLEVYPRNDDSKQKKRRALPCDLERKKKMKSENGDADDDDDVIHLPKPMIGFGVPSKPSLLYDRKLPAEAMGPPYFYFENVALAPKGVWNTMSRCLYEVEPEFVDSQYFCAAARKRGYIHNLPIQNRFPLLPPPPQSIYEAFPLYRKWWPSWDRRTKLNCLQTCVASARLTERIRKAVETYDTDPPENIQKYVVEQCRKWNLVWVGRNKVAPLEPDEVELLLGFPKNHTRGGGISRTDRYKSLGNSFQVDTVAYHLSVLKNMFPSGINLLSLFSGIGGAEVALHRLGIPLKNVVSVDISEANRNVIRSWWEQTNQKGNLIEIPDVQELDHTRLEAIMSTCGGFDLVVGGSPCNNLTGSNRYTRDGLEGEHSSLFYDFTRILQSVKDIMSKRGNQ